MSNFAESSASASNVRDLNSQKRSSVATPAGTGRIRWDAIRTQLKSADSADSSKPILGVQNVRDTSNLVLSGNKPMESSSTGKHSPKRNAAEYQRDVRDFATVATAPAPQNRGPRKTKTSGPGRSSKHQKPRAMDPEFDRSLLAQGALPHNELDTDARTPKRLFNPDRDDAKTFNPQHLLPHQPVVIAQPKRWSKREQKHQTHSGGVVQPPGPLAIVQRVDTTRNDSSGRDVPTSPVAVMNENRERLKMIRQPETRPISSDQLIAEVKGIYAGLIMVEAKCCEVDTKQHQASLEMDGRQQTLNNEQWQALIALHRTLLHEHHDFFLASQHPSASPSLKKLAQKYAMPARMWRHGIHSFLELLRHRLPQSREHMLTFIYLAYSMMALLYETVPAFEDTWIECLGDLARYRMAIEDADNKDRENWLNVARFWYNKAADNTPHVGRLYHHLAILARPNILQQLFYYCKSLGVSQPFTSARESILTVFDPIFNPEVFGTQNHSHPGQPIDAFFIRLHSTTFTHIEFEKFDVVLVEFVDLLDKHIGIAGSKWKVQGFYMAVCNITSLYQYGSRDSLLRIAWKKGRTTTGITSGVQEDLGEARNRDEDAIDSLLPPYGSPGTKQEEDDENAQLDTSQSIHAISLSVSMRLAFTVFSLTLERMGDNNAMPHWHAWMVFSHHIINSVPAMRLLEKEYPWNPLVEMLTELRQRYDNDITDADADEKLSRESFPVPDKGVGRPLPEDYDLRGFDWAKRYFPDNWFEDTQIDEERTQELPSTTNIRTERILWLAMKICAANDWITYDTKTKTFGMHPALVNRLHASSQAARAEATAKMRVKHELVDDSDMEMSPAIANSEGEEEGYVIVVPEHVRKLKEKKLQLEAQLAAVNPIATPETIAEISRSAIEKGSEALHFGYTCFIVDTNLLVSHLDTFKLITTKGFSVIIPNSVITELLGLGNNSGSLGDSAKSAMLAIKKVVAERKDVKVITAKGSDVTKRGFFREKLERDEDDETRNIDDIIIRTTRIQGEERRRVLAGRANYGPAEPAILLTEDTNMRVKANARGVPAISTTVLKRYLVQLERGNVKGGAARSKKKVLNIVTRIKNEDDEDEDMYDIPELEGSKAPEPMRHRGIQRSGSQQLG